MCGRNNFCRSDEATAFMFREGFMSKLELEARGDEIKYETLNYTLFDRKHAVEKHETLDSHVIQTTTLRWTTPVHRTGKLQHNSSSSTAVTLQHRSRWSTGIDTLQ